MAKGNRMQEWKTNEPLKLKKLRAEVYLRQHKKRVWDSNWRCLLVLMYLNYATTAAAVNMVNNLNDDLDVGPFGVHGFYPI